MVQRFKDVSWDNNKAAFIMINDSGSMTPIFKNIADVPEKV